MPATIHIYVDMSNLKVSNNYDMGWLSGRWVNQSNALLTGYLLVSNAVSTNLPPTNWQMDDGVTNAWEMHTLRNWWLVGGKIPGNRQTKNFNQIYQKTIVRNITLTWELSAVFCANFCPHSVQLCGFSPECLSMCLFSVSRRANASPHMLHL